MWVQPIFLHPLLKSGFYQIQKLSGVYGGKPIVTEKRHVVHFAIDLQVEHGRVALERNVKFLFLEGFGQG